MRYKKEPKINYNIYNNLIINFKLYANSYTAPDISEI